MQRRSFFKLLAGAALVPVAAKLAAAMPSVPLLVGDGIAWDHEALQALFDGKVVEFGPLIDARNCGWFGDTLKLPAATYKIGQPIRIVGRSGKTFDFNGARLLAYGDPAIYIGGGTNCAIMNAHIISKEANLAALRFQLDEAAQLHALGIKPDARLRLLMERAGWTANPAR